MSVEIASEVQRFASLLRGIGQSECDEILLERPGWVVAPTLGAVVPGWLLVIPRRWALNFRDWSVRESINPEKVLARVREHLGLKENEVIWFEHGPNATKSFLGCGVDHAHLHVLVRPPFTFSEFEDQAKNLRQLNWRPANAAMGYRALSSGESYLIAGCGDRVIIAQDAEAAGSQYLRRVVADVVGDGTSWDYRRSPKIGNINETIAIFRSLEGAANRAG